MKQLILSVLFLAFFIQTPGALASDVMPGKYPKVFRGDQGIELVVLPLQGEGTKRFLARIKGVESKIDDTVLLFTEEPYGKGSTLTTYINDRKSHTIHFRESNWSGGGTNVMIFLPEAPTKERRMWYDEKLSKEQKPADLVKQYESQLKDGSILKVQTSTDKNWKAYVNGEFKRAVDDAEGPCGGGIGAKIDWDKVKPALHGKIPLATMCRQPAEAMRSRCNEDEKLQLAKKITGITCQVADNQGMKLTNKRLIWSVPASDMVDLTAMNEQLDKIAK